ncbi:MAG: hypothetical protein PHO53_05090 [Actinomycetota bacterium]|nr:hypothetical protein [Actinomycetota bacterium]
MLRERGGVFKTSVIIPLLCLVAFSLLFVGCGEKSEKSAPQKAIEHVEEKSTTASRGANLSAIDAAIQRYTMQEGEPPEDIEQLVPNYLRSVPQDPEGKTYYIEEEDGQARAAVR